LLIWLRVITWTAIVVNWVLIVILAKLLRRANRKADALTKDTIHYAIACGSAMATLQQVAPGTAVYLPEETYRWFEARHLEYMVYGDEV
jgi:hypothetical protein